MFINESFYMRCLALFITAVCLIFLLKLKWPKNKGVYDYAPFLGGNFSGLAARARKIASPLLSNHIS